ncbi:terminase large subunit [Lachnospiraceae bacterium AM23-7LB]|jgi:phage terminase large subunit-like protein|nr:terminase large subunit [Lachnospiraceae bacterium AM23-7LB]RHV59619.1 terminase large subunit [Lachnospiraceae bacterium OM02-26]
MTVKNRLIRYATDCISGKIISCKKHKQACSRFLRDVKREDSGEASFYWDDQEAQKIIKWFSFLRHSKGVLAGKPIKLTEWQQFHLCQLYGWRRKEDGYKRFKKSFVEVARKNAKSQEEAGVALYEISVQATKNKEVYEYYTAGVKRDQSKIVFEEAKLMLNGSPLKKKFKLTNNAITHVKTGSYIKALSKEDGKTGDGTNPAGLIVDEYHQHKTTEFLDLGLGSNTKESLLMIITTAGMDLTYPCYTQEYDYCSKVLDSNIDVENDTYLIDIMEIDPGDDIGDEENWKKANPIRMSYSAGREKIRGDYEIAKVIPEKMIAFLTKMLNVWVQQKENGYMNMEKWKKCEVKNLPISIKGKPVYVGFDMSSKIDLTSVAFVIPYRNGNFDKKGRERTEYIVLSHSFIPNQEKMMERVFKDKVPYDAWERQGFITMTNSEIVDQNVVMDYVLDFCKEKELDIQTLCFDPANASKLMIDLSDEGYIVEEVFQSHKSLNESTEGFREEVLMGNVCYLYNPVLNYAMSNAVIKKNNGLIKIDKDATAKKIDPVDATLCAYKLARYHIFINPREEALDKFLENEW